MDHYTSHPYAKHKHGCDGGRNERTGPETSCGCPSADFHISQVSAVDESRPHVKRKHCTALWICVNTFTEHKAGPCMSDHIHDLAYLFRDQTVPEFNPNRTHLTSSTCEQVKLLAQRARAQRHFTLENFGFCSSGAKRFDSKQLDLEDEVLCCYWQRLSTAVTLILILQAAGPRNSCQTYGDSCSH